MLLNNNNVIANAIANVLNGNCDPPKVKKVKIKPKKKHYGFDLEE